MTIDSVDKRIKISVYDIKGYLVDSLFDIGLYEGSHSFSWDASRFSSGIYFIEIRTSKKVHYKKVILTK